MSLVDRKQPDCFTCRLVLAGRHVARGEWALGHAIASGLLSCARQGGCGAREDCAFAAEVLIDDIRRLVAA